MFARVSNASGSLVEPGKYVITCTAIEEAPDRGFGPGIKWVFDLEDPASGAVNESWWQFTSNKMGPKARARQYVEALLGRQLGDGDTVDPRDLVGRRMTGVVIHEKADDGSDRARLTSCKPLAAQAPAAGPSAPQRAEAPSRESLAALRGRLDKLIARAVSDGTPRHLEWVALDLDRMSGADLAATIEDVQRDVLGL